MVFVLGTKFINLNTPAFCWLRERHRLTVSSNTCHLVPKWFQAGSSPKNLLEWGEVNDRLSVLHDRNLVESWYEYPNAVLQQEVINVF